MASGFTLRRFVNEFVNYANMVIPYDSRLGVFSMQIDFSVIHGRLYVDIIPLDCGVLFDFSDYAQDVACLLKRTVDDLNAHSGFSSIGKNRTFVLFVDKDMETVRYGFGDA